MTHPVLLVPCGLARSDFHDQLGGRLDVLDVVLALVQLLLDALQYGRRREEKIIHRQGRQYVLCVTQYAVDRVFNKQGPE